MGYQAGRDREGGARRRLKLPFNVKAYTVGDRTYFYFRGTNVRLPGLPWSPEFMAVHAQMMAARQAPAGGPAPLVIGKRLTIAGSVNAAIVAYYQSAAFGDGLAASTQGWRRRCLEKFRAEMGDLSLRKVERRHVQKYVSLIPKAGNQRNMGQTLTHFFQYCADTALIADNVADGIKRAKMKKTGGIRPWDEADVEAYKARHPLGSKARLALALYLNFGVRKSDVVRIGPRDIVGGALSNFQPQKTSRTGGVRINVPLLAETVEAIQATPVTGAGSYLVTAFGKPFTANGFGNKMRDWCDQAGLPECSSHGLRKLLLIRLAELGLNTETIMAISGHKNRAEVDTYVAAFNRKKMAAMGMAAVEAAATNSEQRLSKTIARLDSSGKK
jgi:integrase